jgi:hypothetical protein
LRFILLISSTSKLFKLTECYCQYIQNKSKGGIDLDLWFEQEQFLGDLKAHTIGGGLLGNDKFNAF